MRDISPNSLQNMLAGCRLNALEREVVLDKIEETKPTFLYECHWFFDGYLMDIIGASFEEGVDVLVLLKRVESYLWLMMLVLYNFYDISDDVVSEQYRKLVDVSKRIENIKEDYQMQPGHIRLIVYTLFGFLKWFETRMKSGEKDDLNCTEHFVQASTLLNDEVSTGAEEHKEKYRMLCALTDRLDDIHF